MRILQEKKQQPFQSAQRAGRTVCIDEDMK